MPVDRTTTKDLLVRAALRRFADQGWATARIRDVVADAGQANDSAVNYHFGSRVGLLTEILVRGVIRMEPRRRADLDRLRADLADPRDPADPTDLADPTDPAAPTDLADLVDVVVRPLADLLLDEDGRCFLRIVGQVGPSARVERTLSTGPVADTALEQQIELLVSRVATVVGPERARRRVRRMVLTLTAVVADRAAAVDDRGEDPDGESHAEFVDDVVAVLTGGLRAPSAPSGDGSRRHRAPAPPATR